MRPIKKFFIAATISLFISNILSYPSNAQNTLTKNDLVDELTGLSKTQNIDVVNLRNRALERIRREADPNPINRPLLIEQIYNLPQLTIEIQFNLDSAVINPTSYPTLGRIADALYHQYLLGYQFPIVGHTDTTGKREHNLNLSQRRANAIREALVSTFKISPQRVIAVGLGEEQFQDREHPSAAINRRVQIITIGKFP